MVLGPRLAPTSGSGPSSGRGESLAIPALWVVTMTEAPWGGPGRAGRPLRFKVKETPPLFLLTLQGTPQGLGWEAPFPWPLCPGWGCLPGAKGLAVGRWAPPSGHLGQGRCGEAGRDTGRPQGFRASRLGAQDPELATATKVSLEPLGSSRPPPSPPSGLAAAEPSPSLQLCRLSPSWTREGRQCLRRHPRPGPQSRIPKTEPGAGEPGSGDLGKSPTPTR